MFSDLIREYKSNIKGTAKLKKYGKIITQVLIVYPRNFAFQPFIILKLFIHEIRNFSTV